MNAHSWSSWCQDSPVLLAEKVFWTRTDRYKSQKQNLKKINFGLFLYLYVKKSKILNQSWKNAVLRWWLLTIHTPGSTRHEKKSPSDFFSKVEFSATNIPFSACCSFFSSKTGVSDSFLKFWKRLKKIEQLSVTILIQTLFKSGDFLTQDRFR